MEKLNRRDFLKWAGMAVVGAISSACGMSQKPPETTPTATLELPATPTETPKPTPTATETLNIYKEAEIRRQEWEALWPKTPEEAAQRFGGEAYQWQRNPEWPDEKPITNTSLAVSNYINREWRPVDPNNLPFYWPKTAKEAAEYFFPGANLNPKFMQPAWTDPTTGLVTGWHLSEDHWLEGTSPDLTVYIHPGEVAEGYTANATNNPNDDTNWVVFGGFKGNEKRGPIKVNQLMLQEGQGMTIWMPGTDPNAIALRMQLYPAGKDRPYYSGPNGEQLGPAAYGFIPVYPAANFLHKNN